VNLEDTLRLATENNRVCPKPQRWNELYQSLPSTRRVGAGWEPPLPLILGAWWDSTDTAKAARLCEHIEWANVQGALEGVHAFLAALPEHEWHHAGE
jgi:hypothetical protein